MEPHSGRRAGFGAVLCCAIAAAAPLGERLAGAGCVVGGQSFDEPLGNQFCASERASDIQGHSVTWSALAGCGAVKQPFSSTDISWYYSAVHFSVLFCSTLLLCSTYLMLAWAAAVSSCPSQLVRAMGMVRAKPHGPACPVRRCDAGRVPARTPSAAYVSTGRGAAHARRALGGTTGSCATATVW